MFDSLLYKSSPFFIQSLLITIRALIRRMIRDNGATKKLFKQIEEHERSAKALNSYVQKSLRHAIGNAVSNVEFYSKLGLANSANLDQFGFITKDDVRSNPDSFKSSVEPRIIVNGSTSGTSGAPLLVPQSLGSVIREQAFVARMLKWCGFEKGDKRAWLRGDMMVPIAQSKPPYWRYSWCENMIMLSSFHMSKEALPLYIEAMVNYGVDVIQAYPSSIVTLAKYLESVKQYYPGSLKSIVTSSETLSCEDRQLIEQRFRCKVFDWYGLFERVAAIANCEHGRYHVLSDYSFVEFLSVGNGLHEIVGTNFNNHYFPLIRYRTGDLVVFSGENQCPCGRVFPIVEKVVGRMNSDDYVYGSNGAKISALGDCLKGVIGLIDAQFVQEKVGEVDVLVLVNELFDFKQQAILLSNVRNRLGKGVTVRLKKVEKLLRTNSAKQPRAICNVD
ncbi:phenylacetate--CoA ligase family protein [Microbulbifer marinus]|uniref:Phenylacetate-CoA ligase n=1 Tax=Microbulbifer marinus TaxID=658218 RepID=A0A1H4ADM0_9GAMM|nr:phenylacetate--CoA ligase family protein [Microbulbifer marinus]SEA34027.1 phenylacetate-CoA ligase [Microbulbifer marinus]